VLAAKGCAGTSGLASGAAMNGVLEVQFAAHFSSFLWWWSGPFPDVENSEPDASDWKSVKTLASRVFRRRDAPEKPENPASFTERRGKSA